MPKSSKNDTLKDEKKILDELEKNGRASVMSIANKYGFSRQKVWRIIKQLEEEKKIWGYAAVVDDDAFGNKLFFVLLKRKNIPVSKDVVDVIVGRDVKKHLDEIGIRLIGSYFTHGEFDWVICVSAKDVTFVKSTVDYFYKMLEGIISEVKILEVLIPLQKFGINSPYIEDIKDFFKV